MRQTVYIDVLIAINLFVNYFLLLTVAKILNLLPIRKRFVFASLIGSLFSLVILFPPINGFLSAFVKLAMSISIVFVAFGFTSLKAFLRNIATFFVVNFLFGGVIFCLWYFVAPDGILINNNAVYLNISPMFLVIITFVAYLIIRVMKILTGTRELSCLRYEILIQANSKTAVLRAKIDTGNTLKEPFSGLPVVVASYDSVESLIPQAIKAQFPLHNKSISWQGARADDGLKNIRVIPFKTVSGDGLLPAFKADFIEIHGDKKEAYIAVCNEKIFNDGYQALIGTELVE